MSPLQDLQADVHLVLAQRQVNNDHICRDTVCVGTLAVAAKKSQ